MKVFREPIVRTYLGRKFLFTLVLTVFICLVGFYYSFRAIRVPIADWLDYAEALIIAFWYNHVALFCSVGLFWVAIFVLNVLQPAYNALTNYREIISRSDVERLRKFRLLARTLWLIFFVAVMIFLPIVWPR